MSVKLYKKNNNILAPQKWTWTRILILNCSGRWTWTRTIQNQNSIGVTVISHPINDNRLKSPHRSHPKTTSFSFKHSLSRSCSSQQFRPFFIRFQHYYPGKFNFFVVAIIGFLCVIVNLCPFFFWVLFVNIVNCNQSLLLGF